MENLHVYRVSKTVLAELESFSPLVEDEVIFESLSRSLTESRTTLVLGSGISSSVGLPLWYELLTDLVEEICGKETRPDNLATSLKRIIDKVSPTVMARYLENIGITKSSLSKHVRACLYRRYDESKESVQLEPLVRLLLHPAKSTRILHVLTYNFDNSLERCLRKLGVSHVSVHDAMTYVDKRAGLRIYHPHGFLPHATDDPDDEFLDVSNIFSERGYNSLFMDTSSWINTLQIHHFATRCCLFVGLSMFDPSLRRVLEFAKLRTRGDETHHVTIQCLGQDMLINALFERDMRSLGVRVLWVTNPERITEVLRKLRTKLEGTP